MKTVECGFDSRVRRGSLSSWSHTSDFNILHWLPCQVPGLTGSALGLVGPVSMYFDWVG